MQLLSLVASAGCVATAFAAAVPLEERTYSTCQYAKPAALKQVKRQFATDQIVPDLIERINPTLQVNVAYGAKQVNLGTYFTTLQTLNAPTFSITAEARHDPKKTNYTLFMIDPDVPQDGSPVQMNFLHWMVSHVQPSCVPVQHQETVVIYEPLTPASTTQHRYTFLVYREPPGYEPIADPLPQVRTPFDINDYVDDHDLILVGGNFLKESITNGING